MDCLRNETTDRLMRAVLRLNTVDECYQLFEDLCTVREIQDMAQRLEIAFMLADGAKYQDVASRSGVSSATISRVSRSLNYGQGGYAIAIKREREEAARR